jgi:hypothetical protein
MIADSACEKYAGQTPLETKVRRKTVAGQQLGDKSPRRIGVAAPSISQRLLQAPAATPAEVSAATPAEALAQALAVALIQVSIASARPV